MTNKEIIEMYKKSKENLSPILEELQIANGFISQNDIIEISNYLDISEKEITLFIKYKKNIKLEKQGENLVVVCKGPNCLKKGSLDIIKEIENTFNVKEGHTSKDGKLTLETKKCFKKCGFAPNVQINGKIYNNCTKEEIIKNIKNVIN